MHTSRVINKAERKHSVTRNQSLLLFVKQFGSHLLARDFVLKTDHSSLQLYNLKEPEDQVARIQHGSYPPWWGRAMEVPKAQFSAGK